MDEKNSPILAPTSRQPKLSVVMPVYNALPYLDMAIESILNQTFSDFDFVILDDGSNDGSGQRLQEWAARDPRIRLLQDKRNFGPARSSERVARAATAPIVARMDADDISYPNRLAEQFEVLATHADVGVVGGLCEVIDPSGRKVRDAELWRLAERSVLPPFGHGPLMYRRRIFEAVGGYRPECEYWEDQDLIIRMSEVSKVMIIPHALHQARVSPTSTRALADDDRLEKAMIRAYRTVRRLEENGDHERSSQDEAPGAKIDPRVFVSLGSVVLRAGGRPRVLKKLLLRGNLSVDRRTMAAIIWAVWAALEPGSLRLVIKLILKLKNSAAAKKIPADEPLLWSPSQPRATKRPDDLGMQVAQ